MNKEEIEAVTIDDKVFLLINTVDNYHFFVNEKDSKDICVLKQRDDLEYEQLDDDAEVEKAFALFYDKFKDKIEI